MSLRFYFCFICVRISANILTKSSTVLTSTQVGVHFTRNMCGSSWFEVIQKRLKPSACFLFMHMDFYGIAVVSERICKFC
jgi:hypothetical protein